MIAELRREHQALLHLISSVAYLDDATGTLGQEYPGQRHRQLCLLKGKRRRWWQSFSLLQVRDFSIVLSAYHVPNLVLLCGC